MESVKSVFDASRFVLTDMESPQPGNIAGDELERNLRTMQQEAGSTVARPLRGISALNVPAGLMEGVGVFLAGSPANHDLEGDRTSEIPSAGNVTFKQFVFYSLCWNTPKDSVVLMTFSASACGRLEWWTDSEFRRALLVAPAYFENYRPRLGLRCSLEELSDEAEDTRVAAFVPVHMLASARWRGGTLDVAESIAVWLGEDRRLLTFGTYTAELEVDIMRACCRRVRSV
jgi:hypothetical protein